jgi:subtilisin family serine protease
MQKRSVFLISFMLLILCVSLTYALVTDKNENQQTIGQVTPGMVLGQEGVITSVTDGGMGMFVSQSITGAETPKFQGYIVEFEDAPLVVKEAELKQEAEKNKNYVEKAKAAPLYKVGTKVAGTYTKYIKIMPEDIADEVKDYEKELKKNHEDVKERIKSKLAKLKSEKITGSAISGFLSKITGHAIDNSELKVLNDYEKVFNGVALNISAEEAKEIEKVDGVKSVQPNYEVKAMLMDSVPLINADDVWLLDSEGNSCASSGKDCLTGKGISIAIIDTGVDYTHPDLGGCFGAGCKVVGGWDFINNDADPMDDMGHGTHVAATAAGNGTLKGVAPDAKLYAYKVLDAGGSGSFEGVIAGIERAVDPNQDGNFSDHVDIISMSLGGYGNPDDAPSQAIDNAVDAGVVAVIAAGNSGPGENTIGSPGTARKAITVGATDKQDKIASFSSRGPVIWTDSEGNERAIVKPDVTAPGVNICAAQSSNKPWASYQCLDDKHVAISGTSMATPHVAGAAALLKQKKPDWTPEEIKAALRNTAVDINEPVTTQGYGRTDVFGAVELEGSGKVEILPVESKVSGVISLDAIINVSNFSKYTLYLEHLERGWREIITSSDTQPSGTQLYNLDTTLFDNGQVILQLEVQNSKGIKFKDTIIFEIKNFYITQAGNEENYMIQPTEKILGSVDNGEYARYELKMRKIGEDWQTVHASSEPLKSGEIGSVNVDSFEDDSYELKIEAYTKTGKAVESVPLKVIIFKRLREGVGVYHTITFKAPISLSVADINDDQDKEIIFNSDKSIALGGGWYISKNVIEIWKPSGLYKILDFKNGDCGGFLFGNSIISLNSKNKLLAFIRTVNETVNDGVPGRCYSSLGVFDENLNYKQKWPYISLYPEFSEYWSSQDINPFIFPSSERILGEYLRDEWKGDILSTIKNIASSFKFFDYSGNLLTTIFSKPFANINTDSFNPNDYRYGFYIRPLILTNEMVGLVKYIALISGNINENKIQLEKYDSSGELLNSSLIFDFNSIQKVQPQIYQDFLISGDINNDNEKEFILFFDYIDLNRSYADANSYVSKIYVLDSSGEILNEFNTFGYITNRVILLEQDNKFYIVASQIGTWAVERDSIAIFDIEGNLNRRFEIDYGQSIYESGRTLVAGDIDNDGTQEIILGSRPRFWEGKSSNIWIFNFDGSLQEKIIIPTQSDVDFVKEIVIEDVDNDGKTDLAVMTSPLKCDPGCSYQFGKLYIFNLQVDYDPSNMAWPMFMHDPQHTGCYNCEKLAPKNCTETYQFPTEFCTSNVCGNDNMVGCPFLSGNTHLAICNKTILSGSCSINKSLVCQNGAWIKCASDETCENGICIKEIVTNVTNMTCTDTDNGKNFFLKGNTTVNNITKIDFCSWERDKGFMVNEYYCSNNQSASIKYTCPGNCVDGACVQVANQTTTCTDSDGGINYYTQGNFSGIYNGTFVSNKDKCLDPTTWDETPSSEWLGEGYCDANKLNILKYKCTNGCKNGVCLPKTISNITCTDTDNGRDYLKRGSVYGICGDCKPPVAGSNSDMCDDTSKLREFYCVNSTTWLREIVSCPSGYKCENGACIQAVQNQTINCKESDGGINYEVKGVACMGSNCVTDYCADSNNLMEYYVEENDASDGVCSLLTDIFKQVYACPYGCSDGACLKQTVQPTCADTDEGKNYNIKGTITIPGRTESDFCQSDVLLREWFCGAVGDPAGILRSEAYTCQYGCQDGKCLSAPAQQVTPTCKDSDGGINYYVKGTCISPGEDAPDICLPDSQNPSVIRLNEKSCSADGKSCINNIYICPQGYSCNDGACVATPQNITATCQDSDNGKNYLVKGSTIVVKADGTTETSTDGCNKDGTLKEWYCQGSVALGENVKCPTGHYCTNGLCLRLGFTGWAIKVGEWFKGFF